MMRKSKTTKPVKAGIFKDTEPEFCRVPDVQARAGIKRGICYRRIADGTFKSVLLREAGNRQGTRLVFWPSVKVYLHKLMAEQTRRQA
jgi:predicted DNA-binding transcriptional regulator AlpA